MSAKNVIYFGRLPLMLGKGGDTRPGLCGLDKNMSQPQTRDKMKQKPEQSYRDKKPRTKCLSWVVLRVGRISRRQWGAGLNSDTRKCMKYNNFLMYVLVAKQTPTQKSLQMLRFNGHFSRSSNFCNSLFWRLKILSKFQPLKGTLFLLSKVKTDIFCPFFLTIS